MTSQASIRIGTRGSPLALAQAHETRDRLCRAHGLEEQDIAIVVIKTTGDRILDRSLSEAGGKGLFTREIEEALLQGTIDIAVHSMKDMPTVLPKGLIISTMLPREDVRDAFISAKAGDFADLPAGAVVGTASLRRQAQILNRWPHLSVVTFRGNVQTRLGKLDEGVVDATLLAHAGLRRLGATERITRLIATEEMLPAVAQGAIGIEQREGDERVSALLAPLNDAPTFTAVTAERALLAALDGSCRTPIAALAVIEGKNLCLKGEILTPDGSRRITVAAHGDAADARDIGAEAGLRLRRDGGEEILAALIGG